MLFIMHGYGSPVLGVVSMFDDPLGVFTPLYIGFFIYIDIYRVWLNSLSFSCFLCAIALIGEYGDRVEL